MKKAAGLILLLAVIIIAVITVSLNRGRIGNSMPGTPTSRTNGNGQNQAASQDAITLTGYVGGEKLNFLSDPDVVKILQDKYGLTLQADRRGSIEMAEDPNTGSKDFLWPSSQVALEIYKESKRPLAQSDIIFNSPILLYSWASVTDALVKQGVVAKVKNAYYVVDFPKLVKMIEAGRQWKDVGMPQLYGRMTIFSTDPTVSNSGNMFAGLLANVLNKGQVVDQTSLPAVLPTVKKFYDSQGFMEQSSDVIFRQFLNKGMGDKPIIVGYEAQMLEYSVQQSQDLQKRTEAVRMLYPQPTVWSSHPLIAISSNAKRLITALQDPDIQRIAWQKHGFRSASGASNDPKAFTFTGIPETIDNVIPMPSAREMKQIITALGGK